jgi:riboflavin kinase/FMN adenylyltransferase
MEVISGYRALTRLGARRPAAVGIGVFDGVHRGHRALLQQVLDLAGADNLTAVAYTFDPHPAQLFRPERPVALIEPLAVRLDRLQALGVQCTIVEPFDCNLAAQSAEEYIQQALVDALQARHVVVGAGFVFGRGAAGDVAMLRAHAATSGFVAHPVPHVCLEGLPISSTRIRAAVQQGELAEAALFLGRPFALAGHVVSGARRGGSQLGFPTANLQTQNILLPATGVYAAVADGAFGRHKAIVNIGYNPTFGAAGPLKIEAHLPDYKGGEFYGTQLTLHFVTRLRAERRFDGVDALVTQIKADVADARTVLDSKQNIPDAAMHVPP